MTVTHLEEVFERGAHEVDDHDIVVALFAGPHDPGNAGAAHERLVYPGLLLERAVSCDGGLDLDGDLLTGDGMDAEEDGACGAGEEGRNGEERKTYRSRRLRFPPRACTCRRRWCSRRQTLSRRKKHSSPYFNRVH